MQGQPPAPSPQSPIQYEGERSWGAGGQAIKIEPAGVTSQDYGALTYNNYYNAGFNYEQMQTGAHGMLLIHFDNLISSFT